MGLFDYVYVTDPRFVCPEGHSLVGSEFQTKDFGCTMGSVEISTNAIVQHDGGYGDPPKRPLLGRFYVGADCKQCPAFVQYGTGNLCPMSVGFEVEVIDDEIRSIIRVGETTAEFLVNEPKQAWMVDCEGPMTYEQAWARHVHYPEEIRKPFQDRQRAKYLAEVAARKAERP